MRSNSVSLERRRSAAVHPFPARMAPDIALQMASSLRPNSLVLDSMAGSGTVLYAAAHSGHNAIGFDTDPLAVLMAQVATSHMEVKQLEVAAAEAVLRAESTDPAHIHLPWIDHDSDTSAYIDYWFGDQQKTALRSLVHAIPDDDSPISRALRVSLSRTIVTKDSGASLARDVSHSRPHKVKDRSTYDVFAGFLRASRSIARSLARPRLEGQVRVSLGDARRLHDIKPNSVQAVITSPPYLNAIDYIRGHRLSLVWLGYQVRHLRQIRSTNVGSERAPDSGYDSELLARLRSFAKSATMLPAREKRIFDRYLLDMYAIFSEFARVLEIGAPAVIVIGNSTLRGVYLDNATALSRISDLLGFRLVDRVERALPPSHRYLPPPQDADGRINKRMRTEVILTLSAPT